MEDTDAVNAHDSTRVTAHLHGLIITCPLQRMAKKAYECARCLLRQRRVEAHNLCVNIRASASVIASSVFKVACNKRQNKGRGGKIQCC